MKRSASALACLVLLAPLLSATSIQFAGIESGSPVQSWSNMAVVKSQDIDGNNRYGGAGFFQITPGAVGDTWSNPVESGNDLGVTSDYPTWYATPSFITSIPSGGSGNYVNSFFYQQFVTPYNPVTVRQGALAVTIPDGVENRGTTPGGNLGKWCNAFTFTLSQNANFRLGIAVDSGGYDPEAAPDQQDTNSAPDYVSVVHSNSVGNTNPVEVFSTTPLSRDFVPDMIFFDITGNENDVFSVRLWQANDVPSGSIAFALVTFDQLSVSATPTLSYMQADGNIILSWQQNIPGWSLESSTDLGVADAWDPVQGVSNNTAIVPMAGTPKNFFRLKKNP